MEDKTQSFNLLINKIMMIAKSASSKNEKLKNICSLLKEDIPYYNWVGFYIADNSNQVLNLGPFAGEPTVHTSIKYGVGICGQVAEKKIPIVVQDVTVETNYLSCSPNVKAEIVVPVLKNDEIIGELDIDSHTHAPFSDDDKQFLTNVSNIVTQLF
jgi:L-methionine (R)-S-oxide reductase